MGYYTPVSSMGDPGFGKWLKRATRVPKSIRKFKLGRALGGIAGSALGLPLGGGAMPGCGDYYRGAAMGDPFLGGLIRRGIAAVGKRILPSLSKGPIARAAQGAASAAGRILRSPLGSAVAGGAAAAGGGVLLERALRNGGGGGGYRSYRRLDVGNVKALRRAIRRVEGFSKLARKTISFTKTVKLKKRGKR